MTGYWKFNSSLLDERDYQSQLELMLNQELTIAIGCSWWAKLTDRIKSFAVGYYRKLKLDRLAAQRTLGSWIDWAVKVGVSVETNIPNVKLTFS